MAILTTSGRTALAIALAAQPLHLGWGAGSSAWDDAAVPEPAGATALVAEVGRRALTEQRYCYADAAGEISVPTGRYKASVTPTNNLYLRFSFDYQDAPAALIREVGVFVGTVPAVGQPGGKMYFLPSELADPGVLLALQRIPKITRSAATRQSFEFVLTL